MSTNPSPSTQREALEQVGKEGQREAARQLQGRRDRRQGGRDPADRAGRAADPGPRLVTVESACPGPSVPGRRNCCASGLIEGPPIRSSPYPALLAWAVLSALARAGPCRTLPRRGHLPAAGLAKRHARAARPGHAAGPGPRGARRRDRRVRRAGQRHAAAAAAGDARGGRHPVPRHHLASRRPGSGPLRRRRACRRRPPLDLRRELDQRAPRRGQDLRLGRAAPLGAVLDRQPDPRRRRPAAARGRLAQGRLPAVRRRAVQLARSLAHRRVHRRARAAHAARIGRICSARASSSCRSTGSSWRSRGRCSGAAAAGPSRRHRSFARSSARTTSDNGEHDSEPGNQLAGYDARYTYRWGGGRSVSIYGQAIGEDEANSRPSHFLASAGVDLALPIGGANRALLRRAREHDGP